MTSGKDAVRYFLVSRGFNSIRLTAPILKEGLKKKYDMSDRKNWLLLLKALRKKEDLDTLARKAAKKIKDDKRYVICPIRHPADMKYLKENYRTIIIFVDAPYKTRYRRTFLKELGAKLSESEFKEKDRKEHKPTGDDKEYLPNMSECKKLSDEIIVNDSSLNELNVKLERIMRKYKIAEIEDKGYLEGFDA